MSYETAINKAWEDFAKLNPDKLLSVKFLADEYTVDLEARKIISLSCNVIAKDFITILVLHYLVSKFKGLTALTNEWVSFKELSAIEGYFPTFRSRAIEPIIRKYGNNPEMILEILERLPAKGVNQADVSIVIEAFAGVPLLIALWRADAEFGPEANILFDRSITQIFCTEDIVVLAGFVASQL